MKVVVMFLGVILFSFSSVDGSESSRMSMLDQFAGAWTTQSLACVAKLDVATKLGDRQLSIKDLANECECNEEKLGRILRMLTSKGIFSESKMGLFSNNENSALLREDHPDSMRHLAIWYGDEMYHSFTSLYEGVKQDATPFELEYGSSIFSYMKGNPEMLLRFQSAMKEKAVMAISSALEVYDFSQFASVYDIGGGNGAFIKAITTHFPTVKGVVFESPNVASQIAASPRYSVVGGDFFEEVPKGGECYLLKSVLHDWEDKKALQILKKCHEAMPNESTLIVIEPVVKGANLPDYAKQLDLLMMAVTGGRERTEEEMKDLLLDAGFSLEEMIETSTEYKLLLARKSSF